MFRSGRRIQVDLRKWPATNHRSFFGAYLAEDAYGVWLGVPAGSPIRTNDGGNPHAESPFVFVAPRDEWWNGRHFADGGWKLDVTTVPEWDGNRVTMVDLDLDIRAWGGSVWLEDQDEFESNVRSGLLPAHLAEPARNSATRLYRAMLERSEPFQSVGASWLRSLDS